MKQKQVAKIIEVKGKNEEIALDFAGPFQNAKQGQISPSIDRPFFGMAGRETFT